MSKWQLVRKAGSACSALLCQGASSSLYWRKPAARSAPVPEGGLTKGLLFQIECYKGSNLPPLEGRAGAAMPPPRALPQHQGGLLPQRRHCCPRSPTRPTRGVSARRCSLLRQLCTECPCAGDLGIGMCALGRKGIIMRWVTVFFLLQFLIRNLKALVASVFDLLLGMELGSVSEGFYLVFCFVLCHLFSLTFVSPEKYKEHKVNFDGTVLVHFNNIVMYLQIQFPVSRLFFFFPQR